jgi:hypothetical protein
MRISLCRSGTAGFHPRQASEQLPPHLAERPLSGCASEPRNDCDGRDPAVRDLEAELRQSTKAAVGRPRRLRPESTLSGSSPSTAGRDPSNP